MQDLETTPRRLLSFWWLLFWRGVVGGAIVGSLTVIVTQFIVVLACIALAAGGTPQYPPEIWNLSLVPLTSFIWQFYVLKAAFAKKYRDFRIVLIDVSQGPQGTAEVFR
jgi:hypothetical protein